MKIHSILTVVNASADVERSLRERSEDGDNSQSLMEAYAPSPKSLPNRLAHISGERFDSNLQSSRSVSWGILFGSEYLWAPDIGPMLIVCSSKVVNAGSTPSSASNESAFNNCCILQFANQLSPRSSLRVFHGY